MPNILKKFSLAIMKSNIDAIFIRGGVTNSPLFSMHVMASVKAEFLFIYENNETRKEVKNMQMNFHRKLPIPQEVKDEFSLTARMKQVKAERDASIKAVFDGQYDKFILIIGPCSADHHEPVLEYISRLRRIQEQVEDKIIIIPRIYTNKPRTTGQGYKGMLHQPDPESKPDMYKGIFT